MIVSVCIPTYNGATYLRQAVDSVLSQTFTDFELLIVDDCSSDDTAQVVAGYSDPRIRFLRNQHNLGAQENWNRCLAEARGRYFKLLPQDDVLAPACLARQVDVLETDSALSVALVFCARTIVGNDGTPIMTRGYPGAQEGTLSARRILRSCVRRGTNLLGEPGGVLFRRDLAMRVGSFNASEPYVIDLDYWWRLLANGDAYYLSESLVSFRISRQSWSVAIGTRQAGEYQRFIGRMMESSHVGATVMDRWTGALMARVNGLLRLVFYRLVLK
ncbi:glycosyltransferase family 2 protein [Pseudoduganella sp. UC29_106]|uniref:glycosyltransferase family 2 protein n=1 Tax=Pseudoduganella sp. UC29_106 TaxID=3374553 RepID=UPI0037579CC3